MAGGATETENETRAVGDIAARKCDPSASSQVRVAEDRRFELLKGLPPTRFPTMRLSVHAGPGPFVTWDGRNRWGAADAHELRRMRLRMRLRLKRRIDSGRPKAARPRYA